MNVLFASRRHAGRLLSQKLSTLHLPLRPVVLALPRGGVPVAFEVALELEAPLDVFTVRKLGVPGHEELAMGAIATGGIRFLNREIVDQLGIGADVIDAVGEREMRELHRREQLYQHGTAPIQIERRPVILVDDGIATASTILAAVSAVKIAGASSIVIASPVASRNALPKLRKVANQVVILSTPEPFYGVGQFFEDFSPTTDEEVVELLRIAREHRVLPDSPR